MTLDYKNIKGTSSSFRICIFNSLYFPTQHINARICSLVTERTQKPNHLVRFALQRTNGHCSRMEVK